MARYFAGNSLAAFKRTSTAIVEVTTAGTFDSAFVPSSIILPITPDTLNTPDMSITGTVWIKFDYYIPGNDTRGSNTLLMVVYNGATAGYRVRQINGQSSSNPATLQMEYWNGTTWVAVGISFTCSASTLYRMAFKIVLNTSMEMFMQGTSITSGTVTGAQTTMTKATWGGVMAGNDYISQVMIADYDIRDSKFALAALNGNSAANTGQASGVYTDVNETVLDDSTAISITTSGNKAGQTHAALTVGNGYYIAAMVISARGRASGTITDGKLGARSGGTNYSSAALGYNTGYEPRQSILSNDPATSTSWTTSGFNSAEIYEEAA